MGKLEAKDKLFIVAIVVVSFVAGVLLMYSINNYKNEQELSAVEGGLTETRE